MIRLFATDMDGTFLNKNRLISNRNAAAVHDLQDAGVEFLIATGRGYSMAKPLLDLASISCSMINLNGAIFTDDNGKFLHPYSLPFHLVQNIIAYCKHRQINYALMSAKRYYVENPKTYLQHVLSASSPHADYLADRFKEEGLRSLRDFSIQENNLPLKIMIFAKEPSETESVCAAFQKEKDLSITSSHLLNLEITRYQATKGAALKTYIAEKGYQADEVITIGDSLNDLSMLKDFPHAYAMANAHPECIKAAPHLAPSNLCDGVGQVIEQLLANHLHCQ